MCERVNMMINKSHMAVLLPLPSFFVSTFHPDVAQFITQTTRESADRLSTYMTQHPTEHDNNSNNMLSICRSYWTLTNTQPQMCISVHISGHFPLTCVCQAADKHQ